MLSVVYESYINEILKKRYFAPSEKTWEDVARRVSKAILPESFDYIYNKKFVPGGRILFGAGRDDIKATLLNCYYVPIREDSIEGIFDWLKEMARTYSYGGGVGSDTSILRPKNAPVNNSALKTTGAVSFYRLASDTTDTIGQNGRRGALLLSIRVDHPDIEDFLNVKSELVEPYTKKIFDELKMLNIFSNEELEAISKVLVQNQVYRANISVQITDEFMDAYLNDREFTLRFEFEDNKYPPIYKKIKAKDLMHKLAEKAWKYGEPGVLFRDNAKRYSNTEYFAPIQGTNPCGEIWLEKYGCCNLGAVNLSKFVKDGKILFDELRDTVRIGVEFLDNVVDYNKDRHPLPQQREAHLRSRRLGLGIMGLADFFIKLGIEYGSEQSKQKAEEIMSFIMENAYQRSIELAKEKGSFEAFDADKYLQSNFIKERLSKDLQEQIKKYGIRNSALLTVAPTGSTSLVAGTSSGIEPIFSVYMKRYSEAINRTAYFLHPLFEEYLIKEFPQKKDAILNGDLDDEILDKLDDIKKKYNFIETADVNYKDKIDVVSNIQKYVDNSISQTVNLPFEATVEDIEKLYVYAWEKGLKGITVYRDGSRVVQIISKADKKKKEKVFLNKSVPKRPVVLDSITYKIKYDDVNYYVTIGYDKDRRPLEVFVNSALMEDDEWWKAFGKAVSAILRRLAIFNEDYQFIIEDLNSIRTVNGTGSVYYRQLIFSKPGIIGKALEWFKNNIKPDEASKEKLNTGLVVNTDDNIVKSNNKNYKVVCPNCGNVVVSDKPFSFSCDSPCPYCGYTGGKCDD